MTYHIHYLHQPSNEYRDEGTDAIHLSEKMRQIQNDGGLIISVRYLKEV